MANPDIPTARPPRSGELAKRILSALVAAPVALGAVWFGSPWFEILIALALIVGAHEWTRICGLTVRSGGALVWFTPIATLLVGAFAGPPLAMTVLIVGVGVGFLHATSTGVPGAGPTSPGRWAAGGAALLGALAYAAIYLRVWVPDGAMTILWLLFVVWAADVGAYFAGRAIGGPKLAPAISPGKTWSGMVGGLVLAILVGLAGGWLKAGAISLPVAVAALAVAFLVALASVAGDLLESAVKRRFKVKDSGTIMPGHGGVLDRIDGLLTAAPVLAIIAALSSGDPVTWQ